MPLQVFLQRTRQHHDPVFAPFAVQHSDLTPPQVQIMHPHPATFFPPQPRPI
jgi:hypothetical protein